MDIEIGAKQVFYLRLNETIVAMLVALANTHYDSACKKSVQPGGFIHGWSNHLYFAREMKEDPVSMVSCTNWELQTALKICENFMELPEEQAAARRYFTRWSYAALRQATDDERFKQCIPVTR